MSILCLFCGNASKIGEKGRRPGEIKKRTLMIFINVKPTIKGKYLEPGSVVKFISLDLY